MADNDIAIVGMAAHLPGARTTTEYWQQLRDGVECVRELSEEELLQAGVTREAMRRPGYVRAAATLDGVYDFDAEFFGLSPKEAGIMDPQHRHFLMAAWEALEDAAHVPESFDGAIGVFAGVGAASYYMFNILTNPDLVEDVGLFLLRHTGNDKDFLATRASYLFNLQGPSINVQTACSTSLVATHLAVQHLLSFECDLALAGGATIEVPHGRGYRYHEGEVLSPDGHCRAFDHRSQGTVFGSGTGVVALRRLEDALADGDQIYAVVKGTAVNNDGDRKVGYLAPSVDGQAACVTEALAVADVDPESISYVECHGTGTPMGDPIEVAALTQAFQADSDKTGYCRIGSVKTNIGHLDTAAGVASLIKVSLSLQNGELPPSLNYEAPNPLLGIEDTPFLVNDRLTDWTRSGPDPRRAAVNSLGVGGTNAFAVVEEAPERDPAPTSEGLQLLTLSARNKRALDAASGRLAAHLEAHPELDLADVAWTLHAGRHQFAERRVLAVRDRDDAIRQLTELDPRRVFTHTAADVDQSISFMFPGGGAQYPRMAADLYAAEPEFARHLDEGFGILEADHGVDLRPLLLGDGGPEAAEALGQPVNQIPAVFLVEYALAQLLQSWGITPTSLIGHSLGENTAACVSGTISFADGLGLVALRGRLLAATGGSAVVVPLPSDELAPLVAELDLDLAVVNGPDLTVVSGSLDGLAALQARLAEQGVEVQDSKVGAAPHSRLLDPGLDEFRAYLEGVELHPPTIPWVSNRTGTWITDEQATDPGYWVAHLRETVWFSDCIATVAAEPGLVLLEVGPGKTLSSLARMHPDVKAPQLSVPTMRHADEDVADDAFLLASLGRLWAAGGALDAERVFAPDRRRVALPTYAFQNQTFFIAPGAGQVEAGAGSFIDREPDEAAWYWEPVWRSQDVERSVEAPLTWLVLADQAGVADEVVARLRHDGHDVVVVRTGDAYRAVSEEEYVIAPENGALSYEALLHDLVRTGHVPDRVAHLALLATGDRHFRPGSSFFHRNQELGFQSLVHLAQVWDEAGLDRPLHLTVATMGAQRVTPEDPAQWPEQATVLGPVRVIPHELAGVTVSTFDIAQLELFPESRLQAGFDGVVEVVGEVRSAGLAAALRGRRHQANGHADGNGHRADGDGSARRDRRAVLGDAIFAEVTAAPADEVVALRGGRRYVQGIRRVAAPEAVSPRLRAGGVVLVTGGLGGIGLTVAAELFDTCGARLALLARSPLPPRAAWDELLQRLGPAHPTAQRIAAVRDLEARGAEVLVVHGDVIDVERMAQVVAEVRAHFGGLHGVVHAAGVVDDGLIVTKTPSEMDDVLAPKVYGTLVVEEAVGHHDLDLFVVFSSTSTVTAPIGQVDYVAANAFLNSFAAARHAEGKDHVVALNWGVWNEVGMAAAAAGLDAHDAEPEVVPCSHPFLDERRTDGHGVARLTARWETEGSWFLDEHRTAAGEALLPGAGYVELARAALAEIGVTRPFEVRDLTFLRPLAAPTGGHVDVELVLTPNEEGYGFEVRERVLVAEATADDHPAPGRPGWRRTAEASLLLFEQPASPVLDLAAEEAACPTREGVRTQQQDHLRFGPRWDVVTQVRRGERTAVARLRLDDRFVADLAEVGLHPALIDLGTGFAMSLVAGYTGDHLWVPVRYHRVTVHDRLPQEVVARATARPGSSEARGFATFDVALCDPDGRVLVEVEGFTIKQLDGPLDVGLGRRVLASEVELEPVPAADRQLSPSEQVFQHNLSQGIGPAEGRRAFTRVVGRGGPAVVYVSSMDLEALRAQTEATSAAQIHPTSSESNAVFGRPDLDSAYVAPRNDLEEALVGLWRELLGIDEIGVQDDFFELGGHSLIAVRLFAKVKKLFSVDFPISVLFDAPTVEAVAALVAAAMPDTAGDGADRDTEGTVVIPQPRFRHLVAMHRGEGGPGTPFFLVAGMFGNVLNLRHLAQRIGPDRPFYGVQARGLFGDEEPHETFPEMARDYLEEVRAVQPHGPYLLGGFSGGGIAAYEMAQQLLAAGEDVGLLLLLDTPTPHNPPLTVRDRLIIQRDNLADKGAGYVKEWVVNRVQWEQEKRRRSQGDAEAATAEGEGALHSTAIEVAFYRALAAYDLQPYPGVLTLYRPKLTPLHVFGPDRQINIDRRFVYHDNGWTPHCERVDVTEVPGDHDGMVLEPNVRVLAGHLRAALEAAAGEAAGPDDGEVPDVEVPATAPG